MCSQPSDSHFSLRIPFKRVFRQVLAYDLKNDRQYTADFDSGEEYSGSVD